LLSLCGPKYGNNNWPVDQIIRKRKVSKTDYKYLVRWKGTDDDGKAWLDS
jgi:hypothetical protein